jgi:hypothetical protein
MDSFGIRGKRFKRWNVNYRVLLAITVTASAVVAAFFWLPAQPDYGMPFDEVAWRRDTAAAFSKATYDEVYNATRDRMVKDLLKRHPLIGLTRDQVTALLGEPDYLHPEIFPTWEMVYWLGPDDRGAWGHLDSKWLLIHRGDDGKVSRCQTATD